MREELEPQEHAAVFAGLRLLCRAGNNLPCGIAGIATNSGQHEILDPEATDDLCERMNCKGVSLGVPA